MIRNLPRVALAAVAMMATGAALADPPPWAPAHGYRAKEYHYVYYRDYSTPIYYSPEQRLWFWFDGGNWQIGASLPAAYQAYVGSGGVSITLDAARPYEREDYVVEHYGPPRGPHGHHGHGKHHHEHDDDD